jgi:hypothetical protein
MYLDIWQDSLDGGSNRRKASTYIKDNTTQKKREHIHASSGIRTASPVFDRSETHCVALRSAGIYIKCTNSMMILFASNISVGIMDQEHEHQEP